MFTTSHPIISIRDCDLCSNEPDFRCQNWELPKLCTAHYDQIWKYLDYFQREIPPKLLNDFIKIFLLLQDPRNETRRHGHLFSLEIEMTNAKVIYADGDPRFEKTSPSYLKLSRALEYYEGYCWFPANRTLLTALLSSGKFRRSMRLGLSKDSGAGSGHGEQSHRIQWHVVMREVTCDFFTVCKEASGWHYTPLSLFYWITRDYESQNLWFKLFDDNRNNLGWGNPDRVMESLVSCRLPLICGAVQRRVEKYGYVEFGGNEGVSTINRKNLPGKRSHEILEAIKEICRVDDKFNQIWQRVLWKESESLALSKVQVELYHIERIDSTTKVKFSDERPHKYLAFKLYPSIGEKHSKYQRHKKLTLGTAKDVSPKVSGKIDKKLVETSKNGFNVSFYIYVKPFGASPRDKAQW